MDWNRGHTRTARRTLGWPVDAHCPRGCRAEEASVRSQPQRSEELQPTLAQLNTRLAALEAGQHRLSTLSRRLEQLEATQRTLSQSLDEVGNVQAKTSDPAPASEDSLKEAQEPASAQAVIAHYEAVFWNERRDAAWSRETETRILQAWEGAVLPGSHLLMASCQSSLCRLEVGHDNERAHELVMMQLAALIPFGTEGIAYPLIDGEERIGSVFYLAREGYPLPRLEE
jgi:hypothetical protein